MKKEIKRAQFILMVVNHYDKNKHFRDWRVEDSFVYISEELDTADMSPEYHDQLLNDCKRNVGKYVELEG